MGNIIPVMGISINNNSLCDGLFGKTRQGVLSLLYGRTDSSFYTKQILDSVKIGRGTVQRELKNLTDSGIIIREVQGRQVYYRANEASPIFNELKSIVRKTFGVADVIRQSLATRASKIRVAFIFGSVARSSDNRASDIDLMLIGPINFSDAVASISKAQDILQREINPVVYPVAEFKKHFLEKHHFVIDVMQGEKIFIVGDADDIPSRQRQP
jgi:predicted nucleotidyltransferase